MCSTAECVALLAEHSVDLPLPRNTAWRKAQPTGKPASSVESPQIQTTPSATSVTPAARLVCRRELRQNIGMPHKQHKPMPYRKKVRHFDEAGHAHYLTFSCYRGIALLSKDRTRRWLVKALDDARVKHRFDLWAWVIMPEHAHLLIWPRQPVHETSKILADVKRPVGQKAIAWLLENRPAFLERLTVRTRSRTCRRFWQTGPGHDRNVYDPASAHEIIQYIHNNPLRRRLAERAEDWPWSSARAWAGWENVVIQIDRTLPPVEELFG